MILFGSHASHSSRPLSRSRKALRSLSLVSLISSWSKVRAYGSAPHFRTISVPIKLLPAKFRSSVFRMRLCRSAPFCCTYSSSAFSFATSLSARMPAMREEVRRGPKSSSFLTRLAGGPLDFFDRFVPLGAPADAGFEYKPVAAASWVNFLSSASRSAMFARRCFSKSDCSAETAAARAMP